MPLSGAREIPLDIFIEDTYYNSVVIRQIEGHLNGLTLGTFQIEARAVPSEDLLATLTWTANGRQKATHVGYDLVAEGRPNGIRLDITSAGVGVTSCVVTITLDTTATGSV